LSHSLGTTRLRILGAITLALLFNTLALVARARAEDDCSPDLLITKPANVLTGCGPCKPIRLSKLSNAILIANADAKIQKRETNEEVRLLQGKAAFYSGDHEMQLHIASSSISIPSHTWVRAELTDDNVIRIANVARLYSDKGGYLVVQVDSANSQSDNSMQELHIPPGKESCFLKGSRQEACYMDTATINGKTIRLVEYNDIDREPILSMCGIQNFAIGSCKFDQIMMVRLDPLFSCIELNATKDLLKLKRSAFKQSGTEITAKPLMKP
jgi:ferric-dicitrate binding protein FerR (iron transport regulator)